MSTNQNTKRILIFLILSFGIPWAAALVISQSNMMDNNPDQAGAIANGIFVSFPWLANIATRLITREGWGKLWLRPNFQRSWRFYLALWFLPFLATITGGLIFYLLFPQWHGVNLSTVSKFAESSPLTATASPWLFLLMITFSLIFISVPVNTVLSMGEEFGWRAYLLPKLMIRFTKPCFVDDGRASACSEAAKSTGGFSGAGARKAALLTGIIHGAWHLPLILMTTDLTPGVSVLTPVIYLLFTCSLSILLSWGTLNSGSVWPAAAGHGAANTASVLPSFFQARQSIALIGPEVTGLIGGLGYIILALVLLFAKGHAGRKEVNPDNPRVNPRHEKSLSRLGIKHDE
ncbi:MAG: CPBP family intramembrane glutamic endopeptidase [Anaerolineaceae bacterium]